MSEPIFTIGYRSDLTGYYPLYFDKDGESFDIGPHQTIEECYQEIEFVVAEYGLTDYIITNANE